MINNKSPRDRTYRKLLAVPSFARGCISLRFPLDIKTLGHLHRNLRCFGSLKTSLSVLLFLAFYEQAVCAQPMQDHLAVALRGTQASAVILDLKTGQLVGELRDTRRETPGSSLKPLILDYALQRGIVNANTEIFCKRDLHIGSRALPCTHPADANVFVAETALAESCNTYFADLAKRFSSEDLGDALRQSGIPYDPRTLASAEDRELIVLGLKGVMVSPLELALAYRRMALGLHVDSPVARGLVNSVNYGMANGASVSGMTILGKTGTASNVGERWTHGWFAGYLPGQLVLVVLAPHGDGGTAALLARNFFIEIQRHEAPE
jgi:membrane peptidoglycan carboxypeptidase